MGRRLFSQLGPAAYRLSVAKCRLLRRLSDCRSHARFATRQTQAPLPHILCRHNSLIRRKLGNVDMELQENKAVNLALAAPQVTGILIRPGEVFSFWHLVGNPSAKRGYREGLTIANGAACCGVGGGMCQFTNLIHWLVLHSPLEITEHHHHDGYDLFPDFNRQIPFGTGTSIMYNYLDYRFSNPTERTFQLLVTTTGEYLRGELRADSPLDCKYHIKIENEDFVREQGTIYRVGEVYRECVDCRTGVCIGRELIRTNHARVMYDTTDLPVHPI